ncbi:hypothetical protein I302_106114 [Kwoniella bestiolae CBS 10118]|uniref:GAR domain-containing protein n=1 Tax=Kwoniella bestiolae CBS 10118 TaxID=1296100 RepID=A0AAJ8KB32_9TREE
MNGESKTAEDELRDLLPEDAQELRDFLEKRRWFEAKLKSLEELIPIYPFLHPVLISAKADNATDQHFIRQKEDASQYRLPSMDQIRDWQKERDMTEEEVMAFDGGDLERMKEKTRAATVLPLTPPSTHLVSITLDLIVLIDRLLKLLRHRGALLELVAVRLRWDQIRWQIHLETEKIRSEVTQIVQDKGRWQPVTEAVTSRHHHVHSGFPRSLDAAALESVPTTPLSRIPGLPDVSSTTSDLQSPRISSPASRLSTSSPTTESTKSPKSHITPRRSLHIPLLHSQLVNLKIRQQNLVSNQVKRSGGLLDRMIDIAGPLKDLGGVSGPIADQEESGIGAVPEDMLDIQDDVDEKVNDLSGRIAWCKQLEEHWKTSEAHHAASVDTLHHAQQLMAALNSCSQEPATSGQHREFRTILQDVENRFPKPIDKTFPNPTHPAYPENDRHNEEVLIALTSAYNQAQAALKDCRVAVDWYEQLARCRDTLLNDSERSRTILANLQQAIDLLSCGDGTAYPPDLDNPQSLVGPHEKWTQEVPKWIVEGKGRSEEGVLISQKLSLAVLRYQNVLQKPCRGSDPILADGHLIERIEQQHEDLMKKSLAAQAVVSTAQQNKDLFSLAHPFLISAHNTLSDVSGLQKRIYSSIQQAAWPNAAPVNADLLHDEVAQMSLRIEKEVRGPSTAVIQRLAVASGDLSRLRIYVEQQVVKLIEQERDLRQLVNLLNRVRDQALAVRSADEEAGWIRKRLGEIQYAADTPNSSTVKNSYAILERMHEVEAEFFNWESSLAQKIPFLADTDRTAESESRHSRTERLSSINPAAGPTTSRDQAHFRQHFEESSVDQAVRTYINESSVRLAAAISNCKTKHQRRINDDWDRRCHEAAAQIDDIVTRWQALRKEVKEKTDQVKSPIYDLSKLYNPLLDQHRAASESALDSLKDRVREKPGLVYGNSLDEKQWDSTIEPATATVEMVLSEIDLIQAMLEQPSISSQSSSGNPGSHETIQTHNDVFGPLPPKTSNAYMTVDHIDKIQQLQIELDKLCLEFIVIPSTDTLKGTPTTRSLPNIEAADDIRSTLGRISQQAEDLRSRDFDVNSTASMKLTDTIADNQRLVPRLFQLAHIETGIRKCDLALSNTLEAVDAGDPGQLQKAVTSATSAYQDLIQLSAELKDDLRVIKETKRISQSWSELQKLASNAQRLDHASSRPPSTASNVSTRANSVVSTASRLPRLVSSIPRATNRSTSNPISDATQSIVSPSTKSSTGLRIRAVSDTPTRYRPSGLRKSTAGVPQPYTGAPSTPRSTDNGTWPRQSSLPRLSRLSMNGKIGTSGGYATPRSSKPPGQPLKTEYVADAKSKLDVAIGKVVHVPVRPVGLNSADEWKDQLGQYWIGAEGRAKLCFCRILRSRTVMVRVGGGWVELSKFLLDHFADAVSTWQTPFDDPQDNVTLAKDSAMSASSSSSSLFGSNLPIPITSASLSSQSMGRPVPVSHSNSSLASIASSSSEKTPLNKPIGLPTTDEQGYLSPDKLPRSTSHHSLASQPRTPESARKVDQSSPGGPGSPLTAFQFMRKASESPSVREREKERFHGRRSILGKESTAES